MYIKRNKPDESITIDMEKVSDICKDISYLLEQFKISNLDEVITKLRPYFESLSSRLFVTCNILANNMGYSIIIEDSDLGTEVSYHDYININYDIIDDRSCLFNPYSSKGDIIGFLYDVAYTCFTLKKIVASHKSDNIGYEWDELNNIDVFLDKAKSSFGDIPINTVFVYRSENGIVIMIKTSENTAQCIANKNTVYCQNENNIKEIDSTTAVMMLYGIID